MTNIQLNKSVKIEIELNQIPEKFLEKDEEICLKALKSQSIFNNFRNEMGGFTSCAELLESELELITESDKDIGSCYFHIRKDEQVTIRKLAILPEYQKQGWGRLLIYRVICKAIEEKKKSVFLKCPSNSIANQFYQKLGFELESTEQGKNQPINHWRYHIKLPLLFYCGAGGKSKYDAIASESEWSLGINSSGKNKSHQHMMMVDNDYKNYKHHQHLEMVKRNKPLIATALDITSPEQLPEVLKQAEELAQYAGRVLIIPKCDIQIPAKYWLGYSVDSGYGSTPLQPDWFGDRPVHLLGGSPKKQAKAYYQMNVISLDANYAMKLANRHCKSVWSDGDKNIELQQCGCYEALSLSLQKQFQFWRNNKNIQSSVNLSPIPEKSSEKKSEPVGCLYPYIESKKLKDGTEVLYPRVVGQRDRTNPHHWRWGFNWKEKIHGAWKGKSIGSIPCTSVPMIRTI